MIRRLAVVGAVLVGVVLPAAGTAAAATVAAGASPSPGTTARAGSVGIQLLDAPVTAEDDPRAHVYIVDQVEPGQTITRHVGIANLTAAPQSVRAYVGGATIDGGEFRFLGDGRPSDLASWTTISPAATTVGVDARVTAQVTVHVPPDATGGERYGVIWAEVAAPDVPGQAREVSRVGVRMYIDVAGAAAQPTRFDVGHVTAVRTPDGHPEVTADVRNTGARAVDVAGTLRLADGPSGLAVGPVPTAHPVTLAPGGSGRVTFVLGDALPAGPWSATVALSSGLAHADATVRLTFPRRGTAAATATGGFPWSVTGGAVGLVTVAAGGVVLAHRRRHRHPTPA